MLELVQTTCLVVIAIALTRIARSLAKVVKEAYGEDPQPYDYTEIDRQTFGESDLAQRNSDYPLGH